MNNIIAFISLRLKTGDNNVASTGTFTLQNAAGRFVTIIDSSGKETTQRYSANIAEIIAEKSVGEFENYKSDFYKSDFKQENLITFTE